MPQAPEWLTLSADEEILMMTNPSIWTTAPAIVGGIVAVFVGLAFIFVDVEGEIAQAFMQPEIGILLIVGGILGAVAREIRRRVTYYVITTEQVMRKEGILRFSGDPIPMDRITNPKTIQSPIDRLFDKGDVKIATAGVSGYELQFTEIPNPKTAARYISSHMRGQPANDGSRAAAKVRS